MISIAGVTTLFVPLFRDYRMFVGYCLVFGFTISANYCLTTVIVVDLLGMERLTNAYGFVTLSEGIANLIGVPLGGLQLEDMFMFNYLQLENVFMFNYFQWVQYFQTDSVESRA